MTASHQMSELGQERLRDDDRRRRVTGPLSDFRSGSTRMSAKGQATNATVIDRLYAPNQRLRSPVCMLGCIYRYGVSRPDLEGHGHEIVIEPCRAFNRRCLVDCLAVRPGCVADPNRLRRHASSRHSRCAETGGEAARLGAGNRHNGAASNCINNSTVNRARACICARFCYGEDCQPGESRQQLQRWLCIEFSERQGALDRM